MAITRQVASAVTEEERTERIILETPKGEPYFAEVTRVTRRYDAAGDLVERGRPVAFRRLATAIAGESVTLGSGKVLTGAEIMEAIALYCDRWSQESP